MYRERDLKEDLYEICTTYYVKFKLLNDYVYNRINLADFREELSHQKDEEEINQVLNKVNKILQKIKDNGGKLDLDPSMETNKLRKTGDLKGAYLLILPHVKNYPEDEAIFTSFGWVMYDYLKKAEGKGKDDIDIDLYIRTLKTFNENTNTILHFNCNSEYIITLKNSFLWSIRRVVQKSEVYANQVFEMFEYLYGNLDVIFEQKYGFDDSPDPMRLLVNDFIMKLNTDNYLRLINMIGFEWFSREDYSKSKFTNNKGEEIEVKPFAESFLTTYAKKIIAAENINSQEIDKCIKVMGREISKNPSFEWLPYHKIKLLIKNERNEEALSDLTEFGRKKSREFWIWDSLSEVVVEDEKFSCLCRGLLCKSKAEMLIGLQEKIIPWLLELDLFSNAKFELDSCIETREKKSWKLSQQLKDWKNEEWYLNAESIDNRENLEVYARQAEKILYRTLPITDVFITYIGQENGVINFVFLSRLGTIKEGYFYADSIEQKVDWATNKSYKFKIFEDARRKNLYRVYEVADGDEEFINNFIKEDYGTIRKESYNVFAFVDDDYIPAKLVEKHDISDGDQIEYEKKRRFNKKKQEWGWSVEKINSISKVE